MHKILEIPFVVAAQDCAASFTRHQLLKGNGLRKTDSLGDLFGVRQRLFRGDKVPAGLT